MYKSLRRLGLPNDVLQKLEKHNMKTCADVLVTNPIELQEILQLNSEDIHNIIIRVSQAVTPKSCTALELLERKKSKLATGIQALDDALYGGIQQGTITEIVGPSGVGKTQFCLTLTIQCLSKYKNATVIYLDTESAFSAKRLLEIGENRLQKSTEEVQQMVAGVIVYNMTSSKELMNQLKALQDEIIIEKDAKLVIVDSIAALVRKEFGGENIAKRQDLLSKEASILKTIAETFDIPVVCTNHVTQTSTIVTHRFDQDKSDFIGNQPMVSAALGNTWAHCVNTRLVLEEITIKGDEKKQSYRQIRIAKSPLSPVYLIPYLISANGLLRDESIPVQLQENQLHHLIKSRTGPISFQTVQAEHSVLFEKQSMFPINEEEMEITEENEENLHKKRKLFDDLEEIDYDNLEIPEDIE